MRREFSAVMACVYALATGACVESKVPVCEETGIVCPSNTVCTADGTRCVAPAQANACIGKDEGELCDFTGVTGLCESGLCVLYDCPPDVELPPVARLLEIEDCGSCSGASLRGLNVLAYVKGGIIYRSQRTSTTDPFPEGKPLRENEECCSAEEPCASPKFVTGEDITFSRHNDDPDYNDIRVALGDAAVGYRCVLDNYVDPIPDFRASYPTPLNGDFSLIFSGEINGQDDLYYAERERLNGGFVIVNDGRLNQVNDDASSEQGAFASAGILYFASDQDGDFDIFVSEFSGTAYGAPTKLQAASVNTDANENEPFVDDFGNLYFTRSQGGEDAIWWVPQCGL